ncbi:hypothetical protein QA641_14025 [Bradyrhizobium sp. CB1650]|uniref:hypothetical protein n=1 Tax=Bradyrhizobium sp. CB1650 TaxID=3039153 RepID=UPI002435772D|nr:hypothetical protein [Bradyrhizobium sp. CB1650]WGD54928.1 hypothetical protein QA641_14025 [Bradyrhizobium sp. CB1650]
MSQPYIVARMLEAAEIEETDRVLDVGAKFFHSWFAQSERPARHFSGTSYGVRDLHIRVQFDECRIPVTGSTAVQNCCESAEFQRKSRTNSDSNLNGVLFPSVQECMMLDMTAGPCS